MDNFIEEQRVVNVQANKEIDTVENSLDQKLDGLQSGMDKKFDNLQSGNDHKFDNLQTSISKLAQQNVHQEEENLNSLLSIFGTVGKLKECRIQI